MNQLSTEARNLNWLVSNFVDACPRREQAAVVSSDGLLIALSDGLDRSSGDRLAAVVGRAAQHRQGRRRRRSAAAGCTRSSSRWTRRCLFVMSVSDASVLAVTTRSGRATSGSSGTRWRCSSSGARARSRRRWSSELQTALPRSAIR